MSVVLKGMARSVLTLLERYGCIKGNEAEGLRWLIEDTTITEAELKGLLLELKDKVIGCDAIPMALALSIARQITEVVGSE
jgi:hypothetical protein